MTLITLASAVVLAAHVAGAAEQSQAADPIVQVGIYSYRADGSVSVTAYDTAPPLQSTVYVSGSLCMAGAGSKDLPAMAAHAWRFAGKVISQTADEAVVQLDWQRVLDQGEAAATPGGSVQLTLRAGDRVVLDSVIPTSGPACPVTSAAFEARYMPRWGSGASSGIGSGVGRGGGSAGGGRSGGVGAGAGVGTGVGMGAGAGSGMGAGAGSSRVGVSGSGGGGGRVSVSGAQAGRDAGATAGLLSVNLWLVHDAPGRPQQVLHQLLRSTTEGAIFAFAPVTLDTPQGPVVVQVTGSFAVKTGSSGAKRLIFITSRRVTITASGGRPARAPDAESVGTTNNDMPGPDDVLSFEMPPVRIASAGIALPDQFAVRVKITP